MEVSEYFKHNRDSKNRNSEIDKETSNGIMSENKSKWRKSPNQKNWRDKTSEQKQSEDKPLWNRRNETTKSKSNWNDRNKNRNERSDNWNRNRSNNHERNEKDRNREKYRPVNVYNPNMYNSTNSITNTSDQTNLENQLVDLVKSEGENQTNVENQLVDIVKSEREIKTEEQTKDQNQFEEKTDKQTQKEEISIQDKAKITEVNEPPKPTGWRPKKIDTSTPDGMIQQNVRIAQGYLNKMSQVTFEALSEKFVYIAVMENGNPPLPGQLKILIDRIFEQALLQPTFCHMYSLLCEKIHKRMKSFRMVLLNKCQEEFELGTTDPHNDMDEIEKEDYRFKAKKRMLGNINFIAELFKTSVIVEPVMYECFNHLLKTQNRENPDEEQIEALCKLMLNVGKILDPDRINKRIDGYILQLKELQKCNVSPRIRFMIDDVVDISNKSWSSLR